MSSKKHGWVLWKNSNLLAILLSGLPFQTRPSVPCQHDQRLPIQKSKKNHLSKSGLPNGYFNSCFRRVYDPTQSREPSLLRPARKLQLGWGNKSKVKQMKSQDFCFLKTFHFQSWRRSRFNVSRPRVWEERPGPRWGSCFRSCRRRPWRCFSYESNRYLPVGHWSASHHGNRQLRPVAVKSLFLNHFLRIHI